ncbi:MAG: hypothetical protein JJU21_15965 [Salinarimonas sp.]|nr:hypothetical protein [Salinarimonas sp.]
MLRLMIKTWLIVGVIYGVGHLLLIDHIRASAIDVFADSGYDYIEIKRVSLPINALISMQTEGRVTALMDRREVEMGIHLDGNAVLSPSMNVQVGMPGFINVRYRLGRS